MSSAAEVAPAAALPDAVVTAADPLKHRSKPKGGIAMTIVLALVAIFWISPLVTLVITAIRPLADFISNGPLSWPETFTLQNFADAWAIGGGAAARLRVRIAAVASDELDADGAVRADVVARCIDDACRAYLAQCPVLEETRAHDDLELRIDRDPVQDAALPGSPTSLVVTATATEIWPDAYAISVRIRPIDGPSERPVNVNCTVRLMQADAAPAELGNAVRDELIALEHAARH